MNRTTVDVIIKGGRVIDCASGVDKITDVALNNGLVHQVGDILDHTFEARETFEAGGCLVTAGLVDLHVHAYEHFTPLGVNVDEVSLRRGVTTVVDAGSAGASTYPGLQKFIAEKSRTNVFAFLNISALGLASAGCAGYGHGGENDSLNQLNVDACVKAIEETPELLVGVKVRLTADCCNEGKNETEAYLRAMQAAKRARVPVMVHHSMSTIPTETASTVSCPGSLKAGDVYTHCFHGFPSTILDPQTRKLLDSVTEARERGVLFDIGHGNGSFSWTVAELCAAQAFFPDVISSDLHTSALGLYENDLLNIMTKMLYLGMSVEEIIRAVTETPVKVIGKSVGKLQVGGPADVVVMKIDDCERIVPDCQGQLRKVRKEFVLKAAWKDGKHVNIREANYACSETYLQKQAKDLSRLVVRDDVAVEVANQALASPACSIYTANTYTSKLS